MSEKELLDLSDAYNHEDLIINYINNVLDCMKDSGLIKDHLLDHEALKNNLMIVLEEYL